MCRWRLLSQEMASPRGSLQAAALPGSVYALGGTNTTGSTFSSVELFDVRADRWRSGAPMTNARCYGAAVVHNGEVSTPRHCATNATLFTID